MTETDTIVLTDTYTMSADTMVIEDTFVPADTSVATDTLVEDDTYQPTDTYVAPEDTYQPSQDTYVPTDTTVEDTNVAQDTYVADTGPEDTTVMEDTSITTDTVEMDTTTPVDTMVVPVDHCNSNPCLNGGTCVNRVDNYTCDCLAGYIGNECEEEVDECDPNPCLNGGVCTDGVNSYTCDCGEYFTGTTCNLQAVDCLSDEECDDWGYTTVDHCTSEKVCSSELWGIIFTFNLPEGVTSEGSIVHVYNSNQVEWDKELIFGESYHFTYNDLCAWGVKVAVENPNQTWWGCEPGTSSKADLIIQMGEEVFPAEDYFFQTEQGACAGGGEGNLLFTREMLGCPTQNNPASVY